MSVVPVGYANTDLVMFDPNDATVFGTMGDVGFPDPLVKNVTSYYSLKSPNLARPGQDQRYAITVNISITIGTPQVTTSTIRVAIGGKPLPTNPFNQGNGNPADPINVSSCFTSFPLSTWTSTSSTSAILTITGETTIKAENGIRMGVLYFESIGGDNTTVSIDGLTYSYRLIG